MTVSLAQAPNTRIIATSSKGLTFENTILRVNSENLIMVPNSEFDRRLVLTDLWKREKQLYPARTGTGLFYGKNRDGFIIYKDEKTGITYRTRIPIHELNNWSDEKSAIIIEQGFTNEKKPKIHVEVDGKNRIVHLDEASIIVIHNFLTKCGVGLINAYGIPIQGIPAETTENNNGEARYLWRISDWIGLVGRSYFYCCTQRAFDIYAGDSNSYDLGVLVYDDQPSVEKPNLLQRLLGSLQK